MQTDHIALLVRTIENVSQALPDLCTRHELEEQPAEGTLEQYITFGDDRLPALLLMQPVKDGPYTRALKKRGAGLHHIGCVCSSIKDELAVANRGRLLLHPISLQSHKYGTVWLCRPGLPFLVELNENAEHDSINYKDVTVVLPAALEIPDYASSIIRNLTVKSGQDPVIKLTVGSIEVTIDPEN